MNGHVSCSKKKKYADRFRQKKERIYPYGIFQNGIPINKAVSEGEGSAYDCDEFDAQQKESRQRENAVEF